jgi:flagellar basal body-associated protein FliL
MTSDDEAEQARKRKRQTVTGLVVLAILVILSALVLSTVSTASQVPSSDFVTLPTTPLSTQGDKAMFVQVSPVVKNGLAVGVQGYVRTASGAPVVGAAVYMTYYLQGEYRTQVATTDQNGYFQAVFPTNWTGWLPVTLTYFGDGQHQGIRQVFSVGGENL